MGHRIEIDVPGIGAVGGWFARPEGAPRGALVVIQEIFGVNAHMRNVADYYAQDGFVALAPAMFDPVERDVELGYDAEGFQRGKTLVGALGFERAMKIVDAAARVLHGEHLGVGAVGFCWGGTVAYLANTRLELPAVSYYGARTVQFLDEPLRAPMLFHFGERDESIPADDIAAHAAKHPEAMVHVYPAGHAFNRDVDPKAFVPESAALARRRTLEFFSAHLSASSKRSNDGAVP
ncbi:MAG: dienelactone hydrolase family protein [Luteimonas sp.]